MEQDKIYTYMGQECWIYSLDIYDNQSIINRINDLNISENQKKILLEDLYSFGFRGNNIDRHLLLNSVLFK